MLKPVIKESNAVGEWRKLLSYLNHFVNESHLSTLIKSLNSTKTGTQKDDPRRERQNAYERS